MTPDELSAKLARLEELETNFAAALEREKLTAIYQLAYGLSHEFNNPLANISSRAQTLLLDEKDPERRRRLATINAQAFRAHEMIADLMLFAKPPRLERQAVDLSVLLPQWVAEMQSLASEQATELILELPIVAPPLMADPNYLAEAIKAVIKNAFEALGEGGQVTISAIASHQNDDNHVAIVIRDNGPGIPPEVRRHLFDPYFSGREAGRGLGLGLSKCWRILDEHGGRVEVASEVGQGAEFRLTLPITS
ncbi:MAG TPA: HAMP domain-containing sensor histidine kinase [Pirellulaceae bacterium]|nr:HAMP domain-containing sensor histidine kinase [Pirellulaceae bacterium]